MSVLHQFMTPLPGCKPESPSLQRFRRYEPQFRRLCVLGSQMTDAAEAGRRGIYDALEKLCAATLADIRRIQAA